MLLTRNEAALVEVFSNNTTLKSRQEKKAIRNRLMERVLDDPDAILEFDKEHLLDEETQKLLEQYRTIALKQAYREERLSAQAL